VVIDGRCSASRLTGSEHDIAAREASRLRAGGYSRRDFLGAALAAGALLSGCGVDEAGKEPPSDAQVIAGLLRTELAAGAAVIGSPLAGLLVRQDAQHARRLAALAGVPLERRTPAAHDLAAALARKQEAVFAYVQALPKLADPGVRVVVMQILASEAEHLAALRQAAGEQPVPDPFAGFLEPAG
jgi:Ferritin-like domain